MSDERNNQAATDGERVGFCQDCGRPLTRETARPVGAGVFCESCLHTRVGEPAAPWGGAPYGAAVPPVAGKPSPTLAGFLGVIPGVGAMYNGQYAKGLAHFVIFAVLSSLSDNHSLFGLLCFGWFCYMIFDAYHTAKARLYGLPLPNPFGLNDIGERLGFGKNWPGSASRPAGATTPPPPPPTAWAQEPIVTPPPAPASDWVGYIPPTAFASAAPVATPPPAYVPPAETNAEAVDASVRARAVREAGFTNVPYSPAYSAVPPVTPPPAKRFPVGAIWLIGLGILAFAVNLNPDFHVSWHWVIPVVLAAVAVMSFVRRARLMGHERSLGSTISCLRWPVMLMVLAILFALQAAYWFTLGQTWPVLVIVLGAMMLLERSTNYVAPAPYVPASFVPTGTASGEPVGEPPRATWTEGDGTPKEGQS